MIITLPSPFRRPSRCVVASWVVSALVLTCVAGCDQHITTVNYSQVGACDAGVHKAYVFFEIGEINNVKPSVDFEFAALRVSLDQGMEDSAPWPHYFSYATEMLVSQPKAVPLHVTVPHGTSKSLLQYMVFRRQTGDPDGSKEANETPYTLTYDKRDTDPPVLMLKSNVSQSTWRDTSNCSDITAPRQNCTSCHQTIPQRASILTMPASQHAEVAKPATQKSSTQSDNTKAQQSQSKH